MEVLCEEEEREDGEERTQGASNLEERERRDEERSKSLLSLMLRR